MCRTALLNHRPPGSMNTEVITSRPQRGWDQSHPAPALCRQYRGQSPCQLVGRCLQSELPNIMLTHQFASSTTEYRIDPIDSLVHRVFDFHGGPPLFELGVPEKNDSFGPRLSRYTTDRMLWHQARSGCRESLLGSQERPDLPEYRTPPQSKVPTTSYRPLLAAGSDPQPARVGPMRCGRLPHICLMGVLAVRWCRRPLCGGCCYSPIASPALLSAEENGRPALMIEMTGQFGPATANM